jgi:hypothetical protein
MRAVLGILLSLLTMLALPVTGQESPPKPEQSDVTKAETETVPVEAAKVAEKEFVPPDGWRPRKRGEFTVYCRKDQVMGTRFPKETCYDEAGIRAMLAAQAEDREKIDQMRRICAGDSSCGTH